MKSKTEIPEEEKRQIVEVEIDLRLINTKLNYLISLIEKAMNEKP